MTEERHEEWCPESKISLTECWCERRSGKERRTGRIVNVAKALNCTRSGSDRRQAPREARTLEWAMKVSRELWKSGTEAEELLRAKCRWEQKTRTGVILEWGDPREWKA